MTGPVDDAMAADRPEKQAIRGLWVDEVRNAQAVQAPDEVPQYLTLPGALGADISALVNAGLVQVTETGALAEPAQMKIVAVERSIDAVVRLQGLWPGLKILDAPLDSLLHSTSMTTFPVGEHRRFFRAQVVNLDLNEPLKAKIEHNQLSFPILALIGKLARLHAGAPPVDWTLCLTLHGEVHWRRDADEMACRYLLSNFERDDAFSNHARSLLGAELYDAICSDPASASVCNRRFEEQQRFMMALVPKRVAFDAHAMGWGVDTRENIHYGGSEQRAPMVTWVLRFAWDGRASTEPDAVYREALQRVLQRWGRIDTEGVLHRD